jgi:hypothetical protein
MANPKKKKVVRTVKEESYSELEMYCIWLNEYYRSLKKAGFSTEISLSLIMEKDSYPEWIPYGKISKKQIQEHLDEEDED